MYLVEVSIHAPVMGATSLVNDFGKAISVSIHAPVMGATPQLYFFAKSWAFQSTHP